MSIPHQNPRFQPQEVIGEAHHSSRLTVLVEGPSDEVWYAQLEEQVLNNVFFKAVGDRKSVLACYKEAQRFQSKCVVCVADRDRWVLFGCPPEFKDMVLTTGYSIENDILKDSCIHRLFTAQEKMKIRQYTEILSKWFAFQCEKSEKNRERGKADEKWPGLSMIICTTGEDMKLSKTIEDEIHNAPPSSELVKQIEENFELYFRGKHLLDLYAHLLKHATPSRPRYHANQLIDMAIRFNCDAPPLQHTLVEHIRSAFRRLGHTV